MKKKSPKNNMSDDIIKDIENLKKNDLINSYLGNKGYTIYKICLNNNIINFIKKELTVKPFTNNTLIEPSSFPIYQESEKKIYVPRFWGIEVFGYPKLIKIEKGKDININFKGSLRTEPVNQVEIIKTYLKHIDFDNNLYNNAASSALIDLKCGGGKTVLGLYLSSIIKKKTIIFVQKTFLKNQWIERIHEFLPDAKVGSIQGQIIDIDDKDIVIAMVQSISMKSYPESLFSEFGFSIYDEVHHMSSEVFSNCLKKCNTLYSLGLSGTMERKDGLTHVFKMYLGNICYKTKENNEENNVLVKAIDYIVIDDDEFIETDKDYRGNVKYTTMISKIAKYDFRSDFIFNVIKNELKINNDQQIILLSQTKNLLNYLYKLLNNININVGFYIGGMKENDLKLSEKKQIILATYSMAAEALDIKSLTTLILATPKSDIVQAVGRIMRQTHSQPLIIDIIDQHECFLNQFNKRRSFYNQKNYKLIRTNNEKYINSIKNNTINIWNEIIPKKNKKKQYETLEETNNNACCLINI